MRHAATTDASARVPNQRSVQWMTNPGVGAIACRPDRFQFELVRWMDAGDAAGS